MGATALAGCRSKAGSKVRFLTGSGAGAPSGALMRLFARHLGRFGIDATVENLPRAGGKLAAQHLAEAPADGSVVAAVPTGLLYSQLLGENAGAWDLARFEWIGNFSSDRRVMVVTGKSGVRDFASLLTRPNPLIAVATTATSPSYYEALIVRHLTGARIRTVPGFVGGARNLALISGEGEAVIAALDGLEPVLAMPDARILLRLNDLPIPPGTPGRANGAALLRDVAHGPDAAALLHLLTVHAALGRFLALPPGTPPAIVEHWRTIFQQIVADPGFRKEALAAHYDLEPMPGAEVAALLADTLTRRQAEIAPALRRALTGQNDTGSGG